MIPRSNNAVGILLSVQFLIIIAGTLVVTGVLKVQGFTGDDVERWSSMAVFVRNWGGIILAVPLAWAVVSVILIRRSGGDNLEYWHLLAMMIVTAVFLYNYVWIAIIETSPPHEILKN